VVSGRAIDESTGKGLKGAHISISAQVNGSWRGVGGATSGDGGTWKITFDIVGVNAVTFKIKESNPSGYASVRASSASGGSVQGADTIFFSNASRGSYGGNNFYDAPFTPTPEDTATPAATATPEGTTTPQSTARETGHLRGNPAGAFSHRPSWLWDCSREGLSYPPQWWIPVRN